MNTVEAFKKFLIEHHITKFDRVTLTADQYEDQYTVCFNHMGTGLHYPKELVDCEEFVGTEFRIDKVWEARL